MFLRCADSYGDRCVDSPMGPKPPHTWFGPYTSLVQPPAFNASELACSALCRCNAMKGRGNSTAAGKGKQQRKGKARQEVAWSLGLSMSDYWFLEENWWKSGKLLRELPKQLVVSRALTRMLRTAFTGETDEYGAPIIVRVRPDGAARVEELAQCRVMRAFEMSKVDLQVMIAGEGDNNGKVRHEMVGDDGEWVRACHGHNAAMMEQIDPEEVFRRAYPTDAGFYEVMVHGTQEYYV